jgi:putative RNA ligase
MPTTPEGFGAQPEAQPDNPIAIGPQIDLDELQFLKEKGLAVVSEHPDLPLSVVNYTQRRPVRDKEWTPLLEICRGLVIDPDGTIVARPFPRMYEIGKDDQLPAGTFAAFEKLDGSMGVQYPTPEGPRIATRGNFVGRQAIKGSQLLEPYTDFSFDPDVTPLWEIIYPDARLVVDYGDREDITLIGLVETATGRERPLPDPSDVPFPVVQRIEGVETADELRALEVPNAEGFVVRMDETGLRYKVKFPAFDYLTSLRKGTMPYRVWRHLHEGEAVEEYLQTIPGAARDGVLSVAQDLQQQYAQAEQQVFALAADPAFRVTEGRLSALVQQARSGRPLTRQAVWEMVKPERAPHRHAGRYEGPSQ